MDIVTIHTANSTLSQLLARVEAGEEIVLARGRDPIAKLVPSSHPPRSGASAPCVASSASPPHSSTRFPSRSWRPGKADLPLLLDTHALLWWLASDAQLSEPAQTAMGDDRNTIFVSAASAWKIATRHRIGKLPGVGSIVADLMAWCPTRDLPLCRSVCITARPPERCQGFTATRSTAC